MSSPKSLTAARSLPGGFGRGKDPSCAGRRIPDVSSTAPAFTPSELVLGRYRPLRPLGAGGSGHVWLARDEQNGLEVARKIVPREGKQASRAEREAAAAALLRHERCLRAYAFESDSQNVYIAYEYVAGTTLREAIRAGRLDDATAVEAAAQILEGLAHAHARGIVHRDVKPSNVMLADGPGVSIRLLDFGLARIKEAHTITASGDVPGTLAYISPERLKGANGSPPADVWAVGVLLWEALAGERVASGTLAAVAAGWTASALPFFPAHFPLGLAAAAFALTFVRERLGLAATLAVPLFPLGNVSLGLAVVYAGIAVFALALAWREPRAGLFVALGPLLAPVAALGLLPLAAQTLRSPLRRAVATGSAVLLAAIVAGIRHVALPFDGASAPLGLGLGGSESPGAVASELWRALAAQPTLGLEALV